MAAGITTAPSESEATKVDMTLLGSKPTTAQVNPFLDGTHEWGGVNLKYGIHKIADRNNPGELPEADEPVEPHRDDPGYDTPEDATTAEKTKHRAQVEKTFDRHYKRYTTAYAKFDRRDRG